MLSELKKIALKEELASLSRRLLDTRKELDSEEFKSYTPHQQALLRAQYHAMGAYYYALEARIDLAPKLISPLSTDKDY